MCWFYKLIGEKPVSILINSEKSRHFRHRIPPTITMAAGGCGASQPDTGEIQPENGYADGPTPIERFPTKLTRDARVMAAQGTALGSSYMQPDRIPLELATKAAQEPKHSPAVFPCERK